MAKVQKPFLLDFMIIMLKAFKLGNNKTTTLYVLKATAEGAQLCLCKTRANAAAKMKVLNKDSNELISATVYNSNKGS